MKKKIDLYQINLEPVCNKNLQLSSSFQDFFPKLQNQQQTQYPLDPDQNYNKNNTYQSSLDNGILPKRPSISYHKDKNQNQILKTEPTASSFHQHYSDTSRQINLTQDEILQNTQRQFKIKTSTANSILKSDRLCTSKSSDSRNIWIKNIQNEISKQQRIKDSQQKIKNKLPNNQQKEDSDLEYQYFNKISRSPPTALPITKEMVYNLNDIQYKFDQPQEKYFKTYKNLKKTIDKNNYFKVENDLYSSMLSPTLQNKLLLPKRFGIQNDDSDDIKQITLNQFSLRNNYQKIFVNALKHEDFKYVEKLNVSNNFLNNLDLEEIIRSLPRSISVIDLGGNKISPIGCEQVQKLLDSKLFYKLQQLSLSNNNIGDTGTFLILEGLRKNHNIQILDLSFNQLTEKSVIPLSEYFKEAIYLLELYLQWNQINSRGGKAIADNLKDNDYLCVLDVSHNNLGFQYPNIACGAQLIKSITKKSSSMKHLDLSFNQFSLEESKEIQSELERNHTLYGFHFAGNNLYSRVDARGYLENNTKQFRQEFNYSANSQINCSIKGVNIIKKAKNEQQQNINDKDICWICQGWIEHKFEYKISKNGKITDSPIFMHFDFEGFQPLLLEQDTQDPEVYFFYKMVPPNTTFYFFVSNPLQKQTDCIKYKHIPISENYKYNLKEIELNYCNQNIWKFEIPSTVNTLPKLHSKIIISNEYEPLVSAIPRDNGGVFEFRKSDQYMWKIEKSVFKDYRAESEDVLQNCFEFDWKCSRINKFVKNEKDLLKLKQILRQAYPQILHHYKYFSSVNLSGEVFSVSTNSYTEFITRNDKIIDGYKLKIRDMDLQFVATNTNTGKTNFLNPDRALVRFQFMEILVRLASDKYMKKEETKQFSEAFQFFLKDGLQEILNQAENYQWWRDNRYWNKDCDFIYKAKIDFMKQMYYQYAGKRKNEYKNFSNKLFMTMSEFKDLWTALDIYDDFFVERDVSVNFNLAIQLQIDEIELERHLQMNFVEFLEAFARIADKFSPIPLEEDPNNWTEMERIKQPLSEKLGNMIDLINEIKLLDKIKNTKQNLKQVQQISQLSNLGNLQNRYKRLQTKLKQLPKKRSITVLQTKKSLINQNQIKPTQKQAQISQPSKNQQDPYQLLDKQDQDDQQTENQNKQIIRQSTKGSLKEHNNNKIIKLSGSLKISKDKTSISSSSESSEDIENLSNCESVVSGKNQEDSFLSHVKHKKKIKYDNNKALLAYDEIYQRITFQNNNSLQDKKFVRKRSNLLDITINASTAPAMRKFSNQFKLQLQKWGIGMDRTPKINELSDHSDD